MVCRDTQCSPGKRCVASKLKTPTCRCPTEDDCPRDYDPVCGSDRKTYINPCRLKVEACITDQPLVMIKKGVCGKEFSEPNCCNLSTVLLTYRAGVFLASERSDFLREMFGRHLGFFRQRKVGERNKFLTWGWLVGPSPSTVNQTWRLSGRSRLCPNKTPAL